MAELSKNQISGGTPVTSEEDRKDTSKQYSGSPNKTKLASGDSVKKTEPPKMDAIDKRVDIARLLNYLRDSIQNSVDSRRDWQEKLETWYKQYKGVVKQKNFPWEGCSNLHIPITGIIIDTLVSRMINPIFGTQPFVTARGVSQPAPQEAMPGGGNDSPHSPYVSDHDKAYDVEHFLDFILTKRIKVYPKVQDWIREAFIYGRGVMKIVWKEEYRKTTRKLSRQDVEEEIAIYQEKIQQNRGYKVNKNDLFHIAIKRLVADDPI